MVGPDRMARGVDAWHSLLMNAQVRSPNIAVALIMNPWPRLLLFGFNAVLQLVLTIKSAARGDSGFAMAEGLVALLCAVVVGLLAGQMIAAVKLRRQQANNAQTRKAT